jgi:GT2 family glycosyltransferase
MRPTIAAVLVNYNAGSELRRALQSIAEEMAERPWEAIVVDNASSDDSAEAAHAFPQATLIRNARNVGFGRAANQGIAASSAPSVLIMNPDCHLTTGALAALGGELASQPSCGLAAPRILDPDGTVQGSARGDPDMFTGLFGRTSRLRRALPGLTVSKRNVVTSEGLPVGSPSVVVDWVSGACMLARRDALSATGGFDERYFLYWEDADLCRRMRERGYHVRYVPAATAIHHVGHSSRTARAASIRAFHASAYLYYSTHVARGALNPKRALARVMLGVRCWWLLRRLGRRNSHSTPSTPNRQLPTPKPSDAIRHDEPHGEHSPPAFREFEP